MPPPHLHQYQFVTPKSNQSTQSEQSPQTSTAPPAAAAGGIAQQICFTDGPEFAQAIAGHKDASMTAVYREVRGAEWVQVKV